MLALAATGEVERSLDELVELEGHCWRLRAADYHASQRRLVLEVDGHGEREAAIQELFPR